MNKLKLKEELIKKIRFRCEHLKSQNLIHSYDIKEDVKNFSVAPDGVLEYDVVITQKITPKISFENIKLNFKISSGDEFD